MRALIVSLSIIFVLCTSLMAAEPHPLAIEALENLDSFQSERWSYTRTTRSKDRTEIERHDAKQPEENRWTLLSVDGRKPTAKEIERYRKRRADERKRRKEKRERDDDVDFDPSSIRLVSETPERALFHFRLKAGGMFGSDMTEKVLGTLVVNKNGSWAEQFKLEGEGELRPIPGVKISELRLNLTFLRDPATGELLPRAMESRIRGRAFLVKSIDQDDSEEYVGFARAD